MNNIAIYGAGGFGRETAQLIEQIGNWKLIGFFDDGVPKGSLVDGYQVLGGYEILNASYADAAVVIAIANPLVRKSIVSKLAKTVSFPTIVHPSVSFDTKRNRIGKGCIVTANCFFTTGIALGDFSIINLASTIGHDATLGDYCSVMPGCHISGNCKIGEGTMLGTGMKILQNLSIGANCTVGAGTIIIGNFDDNVTIVGVPGRTVTR